MCRASACILRQYTPTVDLQEHALKAVTTGCSGENALALEDDKLAATLNEEGWKAPDADDSVPADGNADADAKSTRYLPAIDPVAEVSHATLKNSIAGACWQ